MENATLLKQVDHTNLNPAATWVDIQKLCEEARRYRTATVCISPVHVRAAKQEYPDVRICTVIGFPNGCHAAKVKEFEASLALEQGADELDMVIHPGKVKEGKWQEILAEIQLLRAISPDYTLKVIIETCLLTQEEKIKLCEIVGQSGADYIKTSTGFSTGGATAEDVALLRQYSPPQVKVKAAGGIQTLEDARLFLSLGADRLGSSRIIALVEGMKNSEGY